MNPKPSRQLVCILAAWLVLLPLGAISAADVRHPVRAGSFYPEDSASLKQRIEELSREARRSKLDLPQGQSLRALILPHAGYDYSGLTAAHACRVLSEKQFQKVLLMGPDHFVGFRNGAIPDVRFFSTPLGRIRVHPASRELLGKDNLFQVLPAAYDREHSLEVVLPFLQHYIGDFELIPVVIGPADIDPIATVIRELVDTDTLVVVSSDLSHFLPYAEARRKDRRTIDAILRLDEKFFADSGNSACGAAPIRILLNMALRFGWRPVLLNYLNSGDTAGDRSRVVGYAALAFFGGPTMSKSLEAPQALDPEQGNTLVRHARTCLMEKFARKAPSGEAELLHQKLADNAFQAHCGTFVTLKLHGKLRGCIGTLSSSETVAEGVRRNAVNAAFHDPRFPPLSEAELGQIRIEVSVLTEPQPLEFADSEDLLRKLRPKVDGVIIRKAHASATFLPQVWEELPKKEDFLSHLCLKAGLPRDDWRRSPLEVSTYQVQHFEEQP